MSISAVTMKSHYLSEITQAQASQVGGTAALQDAEAPSYDWTQHSANLWMVVNTKLYECMIYAENGQNNSSRTFAMMLSV